MDGTPGDFLTARGNAANAITYTLSHSYTFISFLEKRLTNSRQCPHWIRRLALIVNPGTDLLF